MKDGERFRFDFLVKRNGLAAALDFMEKTRAVYVQHSVEVGPYKDSIAEIDEILRQQAVYQSGVTGRGEKYI